MSALGWEEKEQAMSESKVPTVAAAIAFAAAKHIGQTDRAGQPYILHPLRVMMAMDSDEARRVAVLHDVVEDCGVTLEDLRALGYPEREVKAIDALTKREDEHDDYAKFIERVLRNPLAAKVKLADLEDNLDTRRLDSLGPKDFERLAKYHAARQRLLSAK
jgi:(p)ppGpp synthase/HD superfamily hydrolase